MFSETHIFSFSVELELSHAFGLHDFLPHCRKMTIYLQALNRKKRKGKEEKNKKKNKTHDSEITTFKSSPRNLIW